MSAIAASPMSLGHAVVVVGSLEAADGRSSAPRTLAEWVPEVVARVVEVVDPRRIILFGSGSSR